MSNKAQPLLKRLRAIALRVNLSDDRGVSAVLLALSMVVMLGMGALALDVGNTYQERRNAQNAADQISVAAAFTDCSGGTAAEVQAAADRAATANGYDFTTDVTLTKVADGEYEALVETEVATTFGQLLGAEQIETRGFAVVSCSSGGGSGTTLHAHAGPSCGGDELLVSGDDVTVHGGSHSNGDFATSGDTVTLTDGATYGGSWNDSADNTSVEPDPPGAVNEPTPRSWPYEWDIEDYAPDGADAGSEPDGAIAAAADAGGYYFSYSGDTTLKEVDAGIHYVDGNLTISAEDTEFIVNDPDGVGVTFVATGTINIIADEVDITHYSVDAPGGEDNNALLLFSNHDPDAGTCSDVVAISSAGESGISYEGVIFAPNGKVDITTNGAQAVAVWANYVDLDGDAVELFFPEAVDLGPPKVVFEQ